MTGQTTTRLAGHLALRLRALIEENNLSAGMRLPAERQLAATLGVSRSSLREGIATLISEGLLETRRGGGTYVRYEEPWSEQRIVRPLKDLLAEDPGYRYDVLEARHAIEGSTAWYAAMRATAEDKEKLQACFNATLRVKESDDPDLAAQADVRFHLAIAEASHNLVLLQTMRGFFDLLQSSIMQSRKLLYTMPTIFSRLTEQHHQLLQAILDGEPERARKAATAHLGFVHNTLKTFHEDEARRARSVRLPGDESENPKDM